MNTGFSVERSLFSSGTVALQGNVGYNGGSPDTVLRASYSHAHGDGSKPEMAFTMRRLAAPGINGYGTALQAMALSASDEFTLGDILELRFGSELQTIQFLGRVTAFRPFGSADLHLSRNTVLEYRYATSEPDGRMEKGFDSAPADLERVRPTGQCGRFLIDDRAGSSPRTFALSPHGRHQSGGRHVLRSRGGPRADRCR